MTRGIARLDHLPSGFDEATRRNVTENANLLGFGHHEFE